MLCAPSFLTASFLAVAISSTSNAGVVVEPQAKMGEPLNGLTAGQLDRFELGRAEFLRTLQPADGLGPTFNQQSCGACHNNPVGGTGEVTVTRFGAFSKKGDFDSLDALGGSLLQALTITPGCGEVVPAEATVTATRTTTSTLGLGLIEAIADADLQANEDTPPAGVSGRTHIVQPLEDPKGPSRVGRFGWKAQVATVLTFSGDAALNEMGLTNYLVPTENAPNGDTDLLAACDAVADPEDVMDGGGFFFIERVTDFQRYVAAPPQTPKSGMAGEVHFNAVGCNKCHVSEFTTMKRRGLESAISNKTIKPYSDFLLHDMGQNGDFIAQGGASPSELRTPPLWGLRVREVMWHDSRFVGGTFESRVLDAIAAHNAIASEGNAVVTAFNALTPTEKSELVAFLDSLGRAEFDGDGNNHIDIDDFFAFVDCYGSVGVTPDDPCAIHDIDQNGTVDDSDFDSFLLAYDEELTDCNNDLTVDLEEVLLGALDDNMDGIPDQCQMITPCMADIVGPDFMPPGDGFIDGNDLAYLLVAWGPNPGSLADLVANVTFQPPPDGVVDGADLGVLLSLWGECNAK